MGSRALADLNPCDVMTSGAPRTDPRMIMAGDHGGNRLDEKDRWFVFAVGASVDQV